MRLRSHLLALTLATLAPMAVFAVVLAVRIVQREQTVFRNMAREQTRTLSTAVDAALRGHVTSLRTLAASRHLAADDLQEFWDQAQRTLATQPGWRALNLALPDGRRVLQTGTPFGAPLPNVHEPESLLEVVSTSSPAIGDLVQHRSAKLFSVRLPVPHDGSVRYVLSAAIDPDDVLALLQSQRLPSDWVAVVVDGARRIVARTHDHEQLLGVDAATSLQRALDAADHGWFRGRTLEGTEVYTPFHRSGFSGWTVAVGIPAGVVEASAERAAWLVAMGITAALLAAFGAASLVSRRLLRPIASLADAANELGRGGTTAPTASGLHEVDAVGRAMAAAADAIAEREQALRAADRAKDQFLAMLGHELRNPLAALSSAATVLRAERSVPDQARAASAAIARQVRHMTRLLDDLLDVSRVTSNKIRLTREPRDLGALATRALRSLRLAGRLDRHRVEIDVEPAWIDGDEARIEQIVANLVENAVKYSPDGRRIRVQVRAAQDHCSLEVEDDGIGIPADLLPRVFELFVQGERGLDRSAGGLGIGLTLVHQLTKLHGGTVTAHSDGAGHGARFTVALPRIDAPADAPETTLLAPVRSGRCRIVVIEDNDDLRKMMRHSLELAGHTVVEAGDGLTGLQTVAAERPDVVLVDLGLPGIDGYELARRLSTLPARSTMVLIAISGYGQPEARQRALDAGFDEHLTKPVAPDRLVQVIERHTSC